MKLLLSLLLMCSVYVQAQTNTLNVWLKNGDVVGFLFHDQLRVVASSASELTVESGSYTVTYPVDSLRKFTFSHTPVVTIDDITRLINQYLAVGSTLTVNDITALIDTYLAGGMGDGIIVRTAPAEARGRVGVDVLTVPKGSYLVKSRGLSYKLRRRR